MYAFLKGAHDQEASRYDVHNLIPKPKMMEYREEKLAFDMPCSWFSWHFFFFFLFYVSSDARLKIHQFDFYFSVVLFF